MQDVNKSVYSAMFFSILLGWAQCGCLTLDHGVQEHSGSTGFAETSGTGVVHGRLTSLDARRLLPSYVLIVQLYDEGEFNGKSRLVAEKEYILDGGMPDAYAIEYNRADIAPSRMYVVRAQVVSRGAVLLRTDIDYKVLTYGSGDIADLVLVPADI